MKRALLQSRWTPLFLIALTFISSAAIMFPIHLRNRVIARRASCQSNLKQVALGIAQYKQENDGRFPLTRVNSLEKVRAWRKHTGDMNYSLAYGWADAFQPYFKSLSALQCPGETSQSDSLTDPTLPGFSDYWMNENLSGQRDKNLSAPQAILLLGDGEGSADSTSQYSKKTISSAPLAANHMDGYSHAPCFERHLGRANYAFADGHVKWLAKEEISLAPNQPYTFAAH